MNICSARALDIKKVINQRKGNTMKVTLLAHTPEPEKVIAASAKLCYSSSTVTELYDNLTEEKTIGFIDMLSSIGHQSPIEHVSFTFGIEGISRACSHQLVRHRIASYSQKSQRYVNEDDFEFIVPPEIANDEQANAEFLKQMDALTQSYKKIAQILTDKHKKDLMLQGMPEDKAQSAARKKANEDARFLLPNACETKIVVTMNARSLMNFFRLRCCNRAQWEIKAVADEMLKLCSQVAPTLFKNAGPACVGGTCTEGKMSCGHIKQVREYYINLKGNRNNAAE